MRGVWKLGLSVAVASACSKGPAKADSQAPTDQQRAGDSNLFVSTEHNLGDEDEAPEDEGPKFDGDYVVTTADKAHELAEAAVSDRLNPRQTWKPSPLLPSSWKQRDKSVMVLYYPMAADPGSMSRFHLFSAAFRVDVSLVDGTTAVAQIRKRRRLGTVQDGRPSFLERNELSLAEKSLVYLLLGANAEAGENNFWGYLKYFHEHPKFARDIKARVPSFAKWLDKKK